ncbi:Interferon-inducible GTPase 1 [Microtus ochrogaster]|uniref:Interferon-inducible GTPase 1 n=1 Tax=Microtus ochrogaster TaxID=79684 RepID=A0A8J6GKL2_MICOH|nr:Interferon-inducible GTPase 1 [Microtus ochrogaster]
MGQYFSDTSKNEDHGDLESSFTTCFKTTNTESKIITQEAIDSIELHLTKGNIQGANSVIRDALKNIDNVPINVAVTGEFGVGKSSLINALMGVGPEDEGAAQVGVVATTMMRTPYKHPKIQTLTLWDLPGIGTVNFPPKDYLEKVKFQEYDFFIIVSATRFTKLELDLAKAIKFMKKNYYFVRTKVDLDLDNEKKNKTQTFEREKTLQQIRSMYVNTFSQINMDDPQIFLISNSNLSDYDFPVLMDTLKAIWLEACKDGLLATVPVVGILRDDVEKLKEKLNHYRVLFGVDDESLEVMAKDSQVPVEQLKKMIKSPYLLETEGETTLGEMLLKYLEKFASATGGPLATGLYFRKTFYLQFLFLDTVTEDAKVLLRQI